MIYNDKNLKNLFILDPDIAYLNHGSFGACPLPIFNNLQYWQKLLEFQPVSFFENNINENILNSQIALSKFINTKVDDIVFFQNPTSAMNEIMRSIKIDKGDEILTSTHEYGALDKAWDFICAKRRAKHIKASIPHPITSKDSFIKSFTNSITSKTKIIFISHITSATGLIFPIKEIINIAKINNILTIIDGAHVPGHIELDIDDLGADIYTGTCHKWLLSPKGTSFLYVNSNIQTEIDPLIISWGYKNPEYPRTQFQNSHLWQGTRDFSSFLTIPKSIDFRKKYNWEKVSELCKKSILEFRTEILPYLDSPPLVEENVSEWLGQMFSFSIPNPIDQREEIKNTLIHNYKIEIPVFEWNKQLYLRVSINGYNSEEDLQRLIDVIPKIISN